MSEALIILGDQLFPTAFYTPYKKKKVFMAEDFGLCTHEKYHKHKIIFFLAAMRNYAESLRKSGFDVHYEELSKGEFVDKLKAFIKKNKVTKICIGEIQDKFFEKTLLDLFKQLDCEVEILEPPMFMCSREQFKNYLFNHRKPFMKTFYERERKRLSVLIDAKKKPVGGQWSYDEENRSKPPKVIDSKDPLVFEENKHLKDVKVLVEKEFSDHPGVADNFWLPTTRGEALKSLHQFVLYHLKNFGTYQDAITNRSPFMYHSILSPMINMGLLTPSEVIEAAISAYEKKTADIPLNSLEGFVRQVMGWREFVRGIYQNFSEEQDQKNFFNHNRRLGHHWYEGTTGLPPVDDAIKKAQDFGYCHHIERLMILSNVMLLAEVHPREVHRWFMEMFVDSADWVMGPNVYGMGQFSDGGIFATKPYISGSNYILKMSDYKKGEWCDVWDGLFWRFIHKHREFFSKQPRLNFMVKTLEKMDPARRKALFELAEGFISSKTLGSV